MVIIVNNIKEKVKEKIKEYSNEEYLDGYIKNEFLTDNGDADILLKINNKYELFDSRTQGNQLDLNANIYNYIDNKSSMLNNDIQLTLNIIGIDLEQSEKEKIKHMLNEHYAIELYKIQKEYKRYKTKIVCLIVLGLFFLACYALITFYFSSKFFIEVFGFLFSFTLWQAFETLIYPLGDIKLKRESATQKLIMGIKFSDKSTN